MPLAERFIEIAERATLVAKGDALGAQKLLGHLQYMDMNVVGEQVSKCPRNLQTEFGAQVKSLALICPDIIPPPLNASRFSLSTKSRSGRQCDYVIWRIACSKLKFCGASLTCIVDRRSCAWLAGRLARADFCTAHCLSTLRIRLFHIADAGLPTVIHMDVLDADNFLFAVTQASKDLNLGCIRPH